MSYLETLHPETRQVVRNIQDGLKLHFALNKQVTAIFLGMFITYACRILESKQDIDVDAAMDSESYINKIVKDDLDVRYVPVMRALQIMVDWLDMTNALVLEGWYQSSGEMSEEHKAHHAHANEELMDSFGYLVDEHSLIQTIIGFDEEQFAEYIERTGDTYAASLFGMFLTGLTEGEPGSEGHVAIMAQFNNIIANAKIGIIDLEDN